MWEMRVHCKTVKAILGGEGRLYSILGGEGKLGWVEREGLTGWEEKARLGGDGGSTPQIL